MKAFSQHGAFLRRFVALSVIVLTACSDGGGSAGNAGDDIEPNEPPEDVLPSLATQIEHWSPTEIGRAHV